MSHYLNSLLEALANILQIQPGLVWVFKIAMVLAVVPMGVLLFYLNLVRKFDIHPYRYKRFSQTYPYWLDNEDRQELGRPVYRHTSSFKWLLYSSMLLTILALLLNSIRMN